MSTAIHSSRLGGVLVYKYSCTFQLFDIHSQHNRWTHGTGRLSLWSQIWTLWIQMEVLGTDAGGWNCNAVHDAQAEICSDQSESECNCGVTHADQWDKEQCLEETNFKTLCRPFRWSLFFSPSHVVFYPVPDYFLDLSWRAGLDVEKARIYLNCWKISIRWWIATVRFRKYACFTRSWVQI